MGRMLNPAARTLKNSQGQCSENTVLPVLKIQVKIFLSLSNETWKTLSRQERWGAWSPWSNSWQELKHGTILMQLFYHMLWYHFSFPKLWNEWMWLTSAFQSSVTLTTNLCGNTIIHTWHRGNWQLLNFFFPPLKRPPPKTTGLLCTFQIPWMQSPSGLLSTGLITGHVTTTLLRMKKRMGHMPTLQENAM